MRSSRVESVIRKSLGALVGVALELLSEEEGMERHLVARDLPDAERVMRH